VVLYDHHTILDRVKIGVSVSLKIGNLQKRYLKFSDNPTYAEVTLDTCELKEEEEGMGSAHH
jgi:hypothetical protein